MNANKVKVLPQNDLVIERIFDAPRELVWKVWTNPQLVVKWWGPQYFTAPVCKMDFRVGGKYLYCMRSPEGQDYWSTGIYREIIALERIVYTDCFSDEHGNVVPAAQHGLTGDWPDEMLVTLTFEAVEQGKTSLRLCYTGVPAGQMRELTEAGVNQMLDKFAECLGS